MIQKKRGPGRPKGSKNKVVAQKVSSPTKQDPKDQLVEALSNRICELLVIIDYLEEKLEASR